MTGDRGPSREREVLANRDEFLRRLRESPAHKRDLVEELDDSRSTIDRGLRELEEVGFVERGDDGFAATAAGRLALERFDAFRAELADVVAAEPVLDPLAADAPVDVAAVAGGEALLATDPAPYRPVERYHDALAGAERYRALLPALDDPRHVRLLYEHVVTAGRPAELVVPPELLATLRSEFPRRMAAMAETGDLRVFVGEVPPFAVGLFGDDPAPAATGEPDPTGDGDPGTATGDGGTTVGLVVFNESGGVHGVLHNDAPPAVRWAEDRYAAAREGATDRTGDLTAEPDGGTDAVDPDGGLARGALGESLPVALERSGFVRLDLDYFRDEPVADPTTAWRAGLTIPEVHTGYAVERTVDPGTSDPGTGDPGTSDPGTGDPGTSDPGTSDPGTTDPDRESDPDDERRPLADVLVEDLAAGEDRILVGPPGSGKSTVCKRVACEWYDADRGPVLYREGGRGRPFESVEDLVVTLDIAEGHALVVVEDAVRPGADAVFDALDRLGDREDVSVLLDARESEWREPPGDPTDAPDLGVVAMPSLSDRDYERVVEGFERTAGRSVDVPVDRLRAEIREEASAEDGAVPGEVLLLLHRLATYADPLAEGPTSLEEAVAAVHDDLAEEELALDVCTLANALNAAGIEVGAGHLHALADSGEDGAAGHDAVAAALDRLEGRVLFPREDGGYRTVHESWSVAFLAHLIDAGGEKRAAERFGRCVTALLGLAEDPDRRDRIADRLDDGPTLAAVVDDPGGWADGVVEAVYALGRERPKLAPLFGDGDRDAIDLPAACSAAVADERPAWLGRAFLAAGDYDRAERAFERLPEGDGAGVERSLGLARVADGRGEYEEAAALADECLARLGDDADPGLRGRAHLRVGSALKGLGEYDDAADHHRSALAAFDAAGDRRARARTLGGLGDLARRQSEYDRAREYHEESIDLSRELGDRRGEADSLDDLGKVALRQGAFDRAREHLERSVEVKRELGDRDGEAAALSNLGIAAVKQGAFDRATEYFRRALDVQRAVGDRQGAANSLNNLGEVARNRGAFDRAREYQEESLELKRDIGDRQGAAATLNNLGLVAKAESAYGDARQYYDEALAIQRELGHRRGEAACLNNLGSLARDTDDYDRAREYYERALEIKRELGDRDSEASSLNNLGGIARHRGEYDRAREYHEESLELRRETGDRGGRASSLNDLGELARLRGAYDRAREHHERSLEIRREIGDRRGEAHCLYNLARVARRRGDPDRAREWLSESLDLQRELDDTEGEAACLRELGAVERLAGEGDRAGDRLDRALATFEELGGTLGATKCRLELGQLALARDDHEGARERARAASEAFEDLGTPHWTARSRLLLGRVAAAEGDTATAREEFESALGTFDDLGAPDDALATLRRLVELAREDGDGAPGGDRGDEWCRRARDLVAEAPDPTAELHREWVAHECPDADGSPDADPGSG